MNLSPEILKMRDALLERIGDKPLKEVAEIVNEILLNETNNINRLAALAARVKVLREHINSNYDVKNNSKKRELLKNVSNFKKEAVSENNDTNSMEKNESPGKADWVRVEMLKSGVVNGVRFPSGVIIDVNKKDAEKLVSDNLSKIVSTENNSSVENKVKSKIEKATDEVLKTEEWSMNREKDLKI